ncbi:conserved membrane protein of unknown function [Tenacibaculum sp. 190524A02b]
MFCGVIFFSFEFIPNLSDEQFIAQTEFDNLKKQNTLALGKLKELTKDTSEYKEYISINKEKNLAYKKLKEIKESKKVFGFINLKIFLYHFGIAMCLFVYGVFNLFQSFYFERKNFSSKVLHGFIIFISLFKFYWVFQSYSDYSVFTYSIVSVFSLFILVLFVKLRTKYQDHNINRLRLYLYHISKKALLSANTEENRKEILNMVEDLNNGKEIKQGINKLKNV